MKNQAFQWYKIYCQEALLKQRNHRPNAHIPVLTFVRFNFTVMCQKRRFSMNKYNEIDCGCNAKILDMSGSKSEWKWFNRILKAFNPVVSYICKEGRIWNDRTKRRNIFSGCNRHLGGREKTMTRVHKFKFEQQCWNYSNLGHVLHPVSEKNVKYTTKIMNYTWTLVLLWTCFAILYQLFTQ